MISLANLYTKTGDKGQTSLYGGERISKNSIKVECYGIMDEANSMLGLAYSYKRESSVWEQNLPVMKKEKKC